MDKDKVYSLTTAMFDFFGRKQGQSTQELANEFKALNEVDKAEFKAALIAKGYRIA